MAGNNAAYNAEDPNSLDHRYLHPEERELAEQLAQDSDGRFTAQEMLDTLRHARSSEAPDYPQGMSSEVLDIERATDETFQYLDGSEGRLLVTQGEDGNARYIVKDMKSIPLNDDAKDYITQQDLGYSFYEPAARIDDPSIPRDTLTGRPLDDTGRYKVGYNVDGNIYSVPHYSCATADCLSQQMNVDWSSPEGQAYRNALTAQGLDDLSSAANLGLLISPVGPWAFVLSTTATVAGGGSAYMNGELINETAEFGMSSLHGKALVEMLGKRSGVRVNTLLDLSGYHDNTTDFIPDDSTVREGLNNYLNGDDDEGN
ncbi:hypothetical protein [Aliidiomarina soli]|uniref:Uncharacterized protein n=1 Tax=Aliidiomarina soli TaxID=1928574 RepID=A0A432WE21_9GAMM|nr:hypothetical protein [Aliidiomarina soli]RUO31131.1 hypothetical protein CWE14_11590 [Aliidiomarina soli]